MNPLEQLTSSAWAYLDETDESFHAVMSRQTIEAIAPYSDLNAQVIAYNHPIWEYLIDCYRELRFDIHRATLKIRIDHGFSYGQVIFQRET